jgi:hypothetical protein
MRTIQTISFVRYAAFITLAIIVNVLVFASRAGSFAAGAASRQDLVRTGLFFDCAITIPLCYWLLLVRPGLRGKASLVLVGALSLIRGAYLLSSRTGMFIGIAAEAALVLFIVTKVRRIEDVLPSKTLARIARAEIDVYRYAFGLSKKAELPTGARAFTIHEASGAASLFWLLACLTPIEAGAVHFILPAKLAWILTALSIYGAIWMIAVARSFTALPIIVDDRGITLRRGMLTSMYVPREAIASVARKEGQGKYARFAVLADPSVYISFHQPLEVELPMGFTRKVRGASIAPDDAAGFFKAISES